MLSETCRGGVHGDGLSEALVARLAVRFRGEGVSGKRPPAVLEEKRPWWLLSGVDIEAVAIVQ